MNNEQKIKTYRSKGNICFKNRNFLDAISYYKKGLQLDATDPHLNSNLAQAYLEERNFKSAEYYAQIAIASSKDSAKGYFRAAKASAGLGDRTKAVKYLRDGIEHCNNSNTEDLRNYLRTLYEEGPSCIGVTSQSPQGDLTGNEDVPSLTSDSDSDEDILNDKLRSRSTSRMPATTLFLDSNETSNINHRSVSMSRADNSYTQIQANKPNNKKKKKEKRSLPEKNPFIATLESIKKEMGVHEITPEQFWSMQRNELQSLLKEGSEIMASRLPRKAVEKYKAAIDMILDHSLENFRMKEIDLIVLKYALCICWIELASYADIVKAVECLKEIQDNHVSKFPAVFYGLGNAYYKLNRYKVAVEHLEKGLIFLKRGIKFETHSWPGTNSVISETTRSGLEGVLKGLLKTCAYREPDATCRYSQCHNVSSHIIPSEHIFYSDPDFCGFVTVICQEKCRIEYHLGCWKDYKEAIMSSEIGKLSDKDIIGRSCPTTDCVTQANERSEIIKIEIVGDDATVRTSIEAPKMETPIKESKKTKKKKNEKITEVAAQDKPKTKLRPKTKKTLTETVQTTTTTTTTATQESQAASSAEELALRLDKLKLLRDVNFGYTDDDCWNPKENCYGREDVLYLDQFLGPENAGESEALKGKKEFVFSYFYEFIRNEGPQKIKEVERKWQNEAGDFEGVNDFINSHTSIYSFLLQSYRFAAVEDYMCIAEQLAHTYSMTKTELVESLSFTLKGFDSYTQSDFNVNTEMVAECPTNHKLKSVLGSDIYKHTCDSKSAVDTLLVPTIPDVSQDPGISAAEYNFMGHFTSQTESITRGKEKVYSFLSDSSCDDSDEVDSKCDGVDDDDDDDDDGDDDDDDDGGEEQEKENGMVTEEEQTGGFNSSLNCDAVEFNPLAKEAAEQRENLCHKEVAETRSIARNVSAPVEELQLIAASSECNVSAYSDAGKCLLEDGCTEGSSPCEVSASSHRTNATAATEPVLPSQQLCELSYSNTLADEMGNFEEKSSGLESTMNKLQMELKNENEKEPLKKTSEDSELEQLEEKIQEFELERTKVMEEKNKEFEILKEKLRKKEDECEAEKVKFEEIRREKEISEKKTKEIIRNLISETGQKMKELEEELEVRKHDALQWQHLVLKAKKEGGEMQLKYLKQKCFDVLETMRSRVKYLTDSGIPDKADIEVAIKNWELYLLAITEYEIQFIVRCTSLTEKSGAITLADFVQLEWPDPPKEPSCPLDMLEEEMLKTLDEVEDMKGKLIAQDKEMVQMKADQQKVSDDLSALEKKQLRLKKEIDRQGKVNSSLSAKKLALKPDMSGKVNEGVEVSDPSGSVGEVIEQSVQPEQKKNVKQNINSNTYFPSAPFQVSSLVGVPMYQHSTQNYGYQPVLPSSPYFYTSSPVYTMSVPIQQTPPVTSYQPTARFSSVENVKPSAQQEAGHKPAQSFPLTEVPKIAVSATSVTEKSQPPLGSKAVPENKKSLSAASGLTPIELTRTLPLSSRCAVATSQATTVPEAVSAVGATKQKLSQVSDSADAPKPPLQMPFEIHAAPVLEPSVDSATAPKPKATCNFQKLMKQLQGHFPTKTEDELASSVAVVRERNNNSLTGHTVPSIINMVDKVLKEKSSKKQGKMGLDKFGGTAWGGVPDSTSDWSKSNEAAEDDCIICMDAMVKDLTSLHCNHSFHTKCISRWLQKGGVCPLCRTVDEYPPLL